MRAAVTTGDVVDQRRISDGHRARSEVVHAGAVEVDGVAVNQAIMQQRTRSVVEDAAAVVGMVDAERGVVHLWGAASADRPPPLTKAVFLSNKQSVSVGLL